MQRDLYVFCRSSPWLRGEVLLKAAVELGVHYADTSDERLDVMDFLFYLGITLDLPPKPAWHIKIYIG